MPAPDELADLLPPFVAVESWSGGASEEDRGISGLFPAERALIDRAVPGRRAEFAGVRWCARRALARLGRPAAAILPGESRAPCWPSGIVGSMTHCRGYRAAAVARATDLASLGIDAEVHDRLPDGVPALVTTLRERSMLRALAGCLPGLHWDRVLFSAKESIYKAWFPLTGRWLDFTECDLQLTPDGTFCGHLLVPGPFVGRHRLEALAGRWQVTGQLVLTAVHVPVPE